MLLMLTACENNANQNASPNPDNAGASSDHVGSGPAVGFVVTTDFTVGNLTTITTTAPRSARKDVLGSTGVHPDAVIRTFGGLVFIIQRFGENSIIVLDPENPSASIANYSTNDANTPGQQSDPHDIAFVSLSKAYVSRYSLNTLLIVNPRTGEHLGTIDLSRFADSDGIVEMDQMVIVNGKLYVSLQRLNQNNFFAAENGSFVVVIGTATDEIIDVDLTTPGTQPIVLAGRNPFSRLTYLSSTDKIYFAHAGNFFTGDAFGGIEAISPSTNTSDGILISDNDFGGTLGAFNLLSETVGYATVFDASFNNQVVSFDLSDGTVGTALTGVGAGFIPNLAFDSEGFLYVPDRDTRNPGIQVFDTTTNQKVEGAIDTGLPPNGIVFVSP